MKKLNKIIFWFLAAGFIFLNIITIWHDKPAVLKHIYAFAGLYKTFAVLWVLSLVYIIIVSAFNGTLFKKMFLPLIGEKEPERKDSKRVYQGLFAMLLILGICIGWFASGMTVVVGHKCKENNTDNCLIEQSTMRTVWLPVVNLSGDKRGETYSFKDSDILYFSAKFSDESRKNIPALLFLFLVPVATIRMLKILKK